MVPNGAIYNQKCYTFVNQTVAWYDAQNICKNMGGGGCVMNPTHNLTFSLQYFKAACFMSPQTLIWLGLITCCNPSNITWYNGFYNPANFNPSFSSPDSSCGGIFGQAAVNYCVYTDGQGNISTTPCNSSTTSNGNLITGFICELSTLF